MVRRDVPPSNDALSFFPDGDRDAPAPSPARPHAPIVRRVARGRSYTSFSTHRPCIGPVAPHHLVIAFAGIAIGQPLTRGTNINIVGRDIDKVLLAETACRL